MDEKLVRKKLMKMVQYVSCYFCYKLTWYLMTRTRKRHRPSDDTLITYCGEIVDYYKMIKDEFERLAGDGLPLDKPVMPEWWYIAKRMISMDVKGKSRTALRKMMMDIQNEIGPSFGKEYYSQF